MNKDKEFRDLCKKAYNKNFNKYLLLVINYIPSRVYILNIGILFLVSLISAVAFISISKFTTFIFSLLTIGCLLSFFLLLHSFRKRQIKHLKNIIQNKK
jgi:hypothetical protein